MESNSITHVFSSLNKALLQTNVHSEEQLLKLITTSTAHLMLKQVSSPKAMVVSNNVMGGGKTYSLELTIGGMAIGLSLITNYDSTQGPVNRYIEVVPVYVVRGNRVHWWAFESDPLVMSLLTSQIHALTSSLSK